jgi:hypothetical protein
VSEVDASRIVDPPPAAPATAAGEARRSRLSRLLRWLGAALWIVDAGSLSLLLGGLGAPWWLAIPLGVGVGGATTYQAQWRFLLSRAAFERGRSLARHAWMAAFVLVVNIWGGYLVVIGLFYVYLLVRVITAALVLRAWGARRLSRAT